jgi:hypothetical protein
LLVDPNRVGSRAVRLQIAETIAREIPRSA